MICRNLKQGNQLDVAGLNQITVVLDRSETQLSEAALNCWRPGLDGPPHKHERKEQIFYILAGEGSVRIGEELFPAQRGDLFYVPANVIHQTINKGEISLDYFLFNAFLDFDKEGHASFAEHVDKMKSQRLLQAQTQRADAGSLDSLDFSKSKGKRFQDILAPKFKSARDFSETTLLPQQNMGRCEVAVFSLGDGKSYSFKSDNTREETLYLLAGSGAITMEVETTSEMTPIEQDQVVFIPGGAKWTAKTGDEGLTCLVLRTVLKS